MTRIKMALVRNEDGHEVESVLTVHEALTDRRWTTYPQEVLERWLKSIATGDHQIVIGRC